MTDYLVGDSRSAMCFSEAMIGLLPGWAGVGRSLTKAGLNNTKYMAMTSKEVKGQPLRDVGIYNAVVEVPFGFPKKERTDDPQADKAAYVEALESHDLETGLLMLPKGLEIATCEEANIPTVKGEGRARLASMEEISEEVERRKDPENYADLWGKPLREVKDEIAGLGRPLAPQSVEGLEQLFAGYDPSAFDEEEFVKAERDADAALYRDPRLRAGLIATLEQKVADFRSVRA
jgi:enoyl-CoA hydratase/carnithine racemase